MPRTGLVATRAIICLLVTCVSTSGCGVFKSRTRVQEKVAKQEKVAEKKAEVAKKAADEGIAEVEKEKAELRRKAQQIQLQLRRNEMRDEAARALDAGDYERAIAEVREIFRFTKEGEPPKDEKGEVIDGAEPIRPPELQDAEKAILLVITGSALYSLDRRDDAIKAFRKAVELDPTQRDARRNLGKILYGEQRWAEAAEAFEKELADGYQDAEILFLLAKARYELSHETGDETLLESARLALERVVIEKPLDKDVRYWRAIITYETRRYREAIRLLEALRRDYPLDVEYISRLADAYLQLGFDEKAIDYLEIAAGLEKPTPGRAKVLSDLYASIGSLEQAAEWRARAYGDAPDEAPNADRLRTGLLFADSARTGDAIEWLSAVEEDADEYADAQARLAVIYQDNGEGEKAISSYTAVAAKRPDDGLALLAIADIYMDREQYDEALSAYSRATAIGETRADGLAGLAEVHYARGNLRGALTEYRRALEERPDDTRFQAAEREIRAELELASGDEAERTPGD